MQWRTGDSGQKFCSVLRLFCQFVFIAAEQPTCFAQDPAAILEDSLIKIVEKTESAVVSIARFKTSRDERRRNEELHNPFNRMDREQLAREGELLPNEFGAGVLIGAANGSDRLILTNYHVVRGGPVFPDYGETGETTLQVHFADRRRCLATIIAADPRSDLAVLRVQWEKTGIKPADFPSVNWESGAPVRKGQFVVLLGNPFAIARDGSASVSWGIVSNLTRQPLTLNRNSIRDYEVLAEKSSLKQLGTMMQLDARLNLGTSGGPVLNLKGDLVGISTSLAAIEGYDESVGFAFPIDAHTRRIVRTLMNGQEVEYGMIGIGPKTVSPDEFAKVKQEATRNGYPELETEVTQQSAAWVDTVTEGSPAAVAGLERYDVVVSVDGESVRSESDLMRLVGLNPPESVIKLTIWRTSQNRLESRNRLKKISVKLCKWPVTDDAGIIETNPRFKPWRGLSVDFSTSRHRFFDRTNFDLRRVLITKVAEDSPGQAALLQPGNFITHVNKIPVHNPMEFHSAVNAATGTVALTISETNDRDFSSRVVQVHE